MDDRGNMRNQAANSEEREEAKCDVEERISLDIVWRGRTALMAWVRIHASSSRVALQVLLLTDSS